MNLFLSHSKILLFGPICELALGFVTNLDNTDVKLVNRV